METSSYDIPTSEFAAVENLEDGLAFGEKYGYPYMLKARTDVYDGKGNYVVNSHVKLRKDSTHCRQRLCTPNLGVNLIVKLLLWYCEEEMMQMTR